MDYNTFDARRMNGFCLRFVFEKLMAIERENASRRFK